MERPLDYLRIKVALDTQILAYLVDNTYPSVTAFLKKLSESPFVDLISSRFAIYEFIGIRKLEHYLRYLVKHEGENGEKVNLSSAIKYRNDFETPELKYTDISSNIRIDIERELKTILEDFSIEYEQVDIHNNLWKPHSDLVLSTKISKEDCLLMLSCIFPDPLRKESHLTMLTNDEQFFKSMRGNEDDILLCNKIFAENDLPVPFLYNLKAMSAGSKKVNLTKDILSQDEISSFTRDFIFEQIKVKNSSIILGKTIKCKCKEELKKELLCFQLEDGKELVNDMYITVLAPDFTSYSHPQELTNFKCWGDITLPYISSEEQKSKEISIKLTDLSGANLNEELMKKITTPGGLVFVHPDSL